MKTESDIERFCKDHGVVISAISARSSRPEKGRDPIWDKQAIHFHVTLSRGDREIWSGFYSVGCACYHIVHRIRSPAMIRTPATVARQWRTFRARFEALGAISPGDVLGSLVMDAQGSDQPFEDWAGDLGYSSDSISAKEIWEACNDIRRALASAFPSDQLATLYEFGDLNHEKRTSAPFP